MTEQRHGFNNKSRWVPDEGEIESLLRATGTPRSDMAIVLRNQNVSIPRARPRPGRCMTGAICEVASASGTEIGNNPVLDDAIQLVASTIQKRPEPKPSTVSRKKRHDRLRPLTRSAMPLRFGTARNYSITG